MSKWILAWLFIGSFLKAEGQALPIVVQDGQKFYQYTIQENQTLAQIQTLFNTDIDTLLALNPGLERKVEFGTQIIVPVKKGTLQHVVEAQQTLYAISRLYEVPVDSLYAWNPTATTGLQIGQVLRIHNTILPFDPNGPANAATTKNNPRAPQLSDSIIRHTVLANETLYAIAKRYMVSADTLMKINKLSSSRVGAGQQILVPIRKVNSPPVPIQNIPLAKELQPSKGQRVFPIAKKSSYNIALFLPFQLDSSSTNNRFVSNAALEYYMGFKMAIDSLTKLGLVADIHIYDEQSKSPTLQQILQSEQMKTVDLIFSPLQEVPAKVVADFAAKNKVPVVFPVQMNSDIVQMAANFMAYTTSERALIEQLASHIHSHFQGYTIVLVSDVNTVDQYAEQHFRTTFSSVPTSESKLKLQGANFANFQKFKTLGEPLLVVSFTKDKEKVQALLKIAEKDSSVQIAGCKDWLDFKNFDDPKVTQQPFLVALPSSFDYADPKIIEFHREYRRKYNSDLTKMACLGYDVTMHLGSLLLGVNEVQNGLITNLQLQLNTPVNNIENGAAKVVWYRYSSLKNYE